MPESPMNESDISNSGSKEQSPEATEAEKPKDGSIKPPGPSVKDWNKSRQRKQQKSKAKKDRNSVKVDDSKEKDEVDDQDSGSDQPPGVVQKDNTRLLS